MVAAPPPASISCHRAVTGLAVLLAAAQCAAAFLPHSGLWSVDHWGYVSRTLFLAAAAFVLLVLSPWGASLAIRSLDPLGRSLENRRSSRLVAIGMVAVFALAFWLGRE